MHSACLMLLSMSMLFYGIKLQLKLVKSTVKSAPGKTTKLAIILRINGMLAVCNICFFLRVVVLGILCSDILLSRNFTDHQISTYGWYIMSNWIPTLIPVRVPYLPSFSQSTHHRRSLYWLCFVWNLHQLPRNIFAQKTNGVIQTWWLKEVHQLPGNGFQLCDNIMPRVIVNHRLKMERILSIDHRWRYL